ncbi:hypothetical protein FD723_18690 [Nostoc sp. C052]|uniref:hypothetical protein n=1 Tax=Nostoc sp. C052 TaxID=2576902 RepID=UPI0015C3E60A|nr:hypothetical protein [Nostoc sp. C052]QLE42248.1 hypothetical protein FD723_18690 [Nostoc sp. C052]
MQLHKSDRFIRGVPKFFSKSVSPYPNPFLTNFFLIESDRSCVGDYEKFFRMFLILDSELGGDRYQA